jgi:hypothetical protein
VCVVWRHALRLQEWVVRGLSGSISLRIEIQEFDQTPKKMVLRTTTNSDIAWLASTPDSYGLLGADEDVAAGDAAS